jgi:hypothetical protein
VFVSIDPAFHAVNNPNFLGTVLLSGTVQELASKCTTVPGSLTPLTTTCSFGLSYDTNLLTRGTHKARLCGEWGGAGRRRGRGPAPALRNYDRRGAAARAAWKPLLCLALSSFLSFPTAAMTHPTPQMFIRTDSFVDPKVRPRSPLFVWA